MLRFALISLLAFPLAAQDRIGTVQVRVSTDRPDWRYDLGQPVRFRIIAVQDGHALDGIAVTYRIGPEMMPPKVDQTAILTSEGITVDGGTMNEPGFLRCIATVEQNHKTYRGLATAAFHPEDIKPTQQDPADFDQFWTAGKAALAKLPIDARVTPLPEYGNSSADCYHVNLQNVGMGNGPSRFYGVLCEPKAPGKYPALLAVPGAGVRPYRGLAEMAARGIITLQVGIHGIPVTMDQSVL
jgi:cephalosporin-C deacetylase